MKLLLLICCLLLVAAAAMPDPDNTKTAPSIPQLPIPSTLAPQASPRQETPKAERQSTDNAGGAADRPLFVKMLPAEESQSEVDGRRRASQEKATEDLWTLVFVSLTGIFTGLLVIVGGGQLWMFFRQLRYMRAGVDDAKTAATAARDAANVAKETLKSNRAWMCFERFDTIPLTNCVIGGIPSRNALSIASVWRNSGNSPALNLISYQELTFTNDETIEHKTPIEETTPEGTSLIGPGQVVLSRQWFLNEHEYAALKEKNAKMLVHSKVMYNDIFERSMERKTDMYIEISYGGMVVVDGKETIYPKINGRVVGNRCSAS